MGRLVILTAIGAVTVAGFFSLTALLGALAFLGLVLALESEHRAERLAARLTYAERLLGSKVEVLDSSELAARDQREPYWRRLGYRFFGKSR